MHHNPDSSNQDFTPQVSVILPVYNSEAFILESVFSILNQSYSNFELIIIDDCSTDRTIELLNQLSDSRIKLIRNKENLGVTASLNLGISLASGEFIARMDADDISLPKRFEIQVNYLLQHSEVGVLGTWVDEFGDKVGIRRFPCSADEIVTGMLYDNCICHPSVMIRKSILDVNKICYPLDFPFAEDYAMWVQLMKYTKIINLPFCLLKYRIHKSQVTMTKSRIMKTSMASIQLKYLSAFSIQTNEDIERLVHARNGILNIGNFDPFRCFERVNREVLVNEMLDPASKGNLIKFFVRSKHVYISCYSLKSFGQLRRYVQNRSFYKLPIRILLGFVFNCLKQSFASN